MLCCELVIPQIRPKSNPSSINTIITSKAIRLSLLEVHLHLVQFMKVDEIFIFKGAIV